MANKDLFEQAIADAKKLKEISMANAKQVIEEAFAPKIQEMFRLKLSEMESLEEDELGDLDAAEQEIEDIDEYAEMQPDRDMDGDGDIDADDVTLMKEKEMEEATLDEILAELELEEGDAYSDKLPHDDITGTEKGWVGGKKDVKNTEAGYLGEAEEEEEEETEETSEEGAEEVSQLSIEDFKNLIRDVVADVMGSQEAGEAGEEGDLESADEVPGEDETISLDEILAELEEESKDKQLTKEYVGDVGASVELGNFLLQNMPDLAKMIGADAQQIGDTAVGLATVALPTGAYALKKLADAVKGWFKSKKKEIPAVEKQLTKEYVGDVGSSVELGNFLLQNMPDLAKMIGSNAQQIGDTAVGLATVALPAGGYALSKLISKAKEFLKGKKKGPSVAETADLNEAVETINYLKAQLSEVNLLNAKLLYVNKIFKAKSLTESQKVKVVSAFDRAATTKEAKNIYETLVDSLTSAAPSAKKSPIKESLGFASKPIGSAPATPIVEADAYVYRMQQLAGIKQPNI